MVVWVTIHDEAAVPGLARKLPHYGKYSYLIFQNGTNRDKGFWPVEASPLVFQWHEWGE